MKPIIAEYLPPNATVLKMAYELASDNSSLENFTIAVYAAVKLGVFDVSLLYQKFDGEKFCSVRNNF